MVATKRGRQKTEGHDCCSSGASFRLAPALVNMCLKLTQYKT